jgi:N-acetylneuraminic acid mutarotase
MVNIQSANASPDSWVPKKPMSISTTASVSGAAVIDGKIYAMGPGLNLEYNPTTDTWTNKTPMPTPRYSFGIAAVGNKIYVIGGIVSYYYGTNNGVNEVYDPSTDTWQTKAPMPTNRTQMNANAVNGKIYLIGGRTAGPSSTVNLTECYDPVSDSWNREASMLYPVVSFASIVLDDKIYVIGGQDEFDSELNVAFNQIYDPQTDNWSLGAPIPVSTLEAGAGATTGMNAPKRIYVVGGSNGFAAGSNQNFAYDPQADVWINATLMPTARHNPAVAVVNDLLYVIGGRDFYALQANEQYIPIGYVATSSPSPSPSPPPETANPITIYLIATVAVTIAIVAIAEMIAQRKNKKQQLKHSL